MNGTSSNQKGLLRRVGLATSLTVAGTLAIAPLAGAATAVAKVRANWEAFFSPKTSVVEKVALLQNGPKFAAVIKGQRALMGAVSAKVSKVVVHGSKSATVHYTIFEGGRPVLKNQTGTAVFQAKRWKVGDASFCGLLRLEGAKVKACAGIR
ncbi:MAG: hypothetical protein M0014_12565 [Actinomycetota bacterium]|jgi:hypothetical protein|nr:hypothetical protein [Actinomycetota bacterium]